MIHFDRKEDCCGCSACYAICPKSCIVMKEDIEGFLYPHVDEQRCTHCDICNKTCPIININYEHKEKPIAYVAYCNEDELRLSSSSGGIFGLLAEKVLEMNGIVFGAAFDKDMLVHHIGINKRSEMDALRGSKYLQSRVEGSYLKAEKALKEQKYVLFSGTACQIAGLKNYLKRDYENLYTLDVLCHGTPTPNLWKKYLASQVLSVGAAICSVSFRNKTKGWKDYSIKITFDNNYEYNELFYKNSYMQLFLSDICLRPSCYECKYKNINRPSDITLGDCWGIEDYMPEMDDGKGTSIILVHTTKGKQLLDRISAGLFMKEGELDRILSPDAASRKSVKRHPKREEFFSKIDVKSIDELKRIALPSFYNRAFLSLKRIIMK